MNTTLNQTPPPFLPEDDAYRVELHDEVHARPTARVRLPALVTYVAVLNAGITRDTELAHLQQLPGQSGLSIDSLHANFLRLQCEGYTVKWERHTEFTRYSIVQALPAHTLLGANAPALIAATTAAMCP